MSRRRLALAGGALDGVIQPPSAAVGNFANLYDIARVRGGSESGMNVGFRKIREIKPFAANQASQDQLYTMFDTVGTKNQKLAEEWLVACFALPLALPGIALTVGMLKLLPWYVAIPAVAGLLAVHVVPLAPFTLAMLRNTVAQLDRSLENTVNAVSTLNSAVTGLLLVAVNRFVRLDRVWHR